jgi:hypothetical protein
MKAKILSENLRQMDFERKRLKPLASAILIFAGLNTCFAIEGLKLSVHCPDVVLSWLSSDVETYIVQYRPTLDTNSSWTTLTNWMPGAASTNLTTFVHADMVDCPAGQVFMMGNSGGSSESFSSLTAWEEQQLQEQHEAERLIALLEQCEKEGREPWLWELENRPPYPWEDTELATAYYLAGGGEVMESGGGQAPQTGFYRVVQNGVRLVGVTNGATMSGIVELPVELALDEFSVPLDVGLSPDDEVPQPRGVQFYSFTGTNDVPRLIWNTHLATNGNYTLSPAANYAGDFSVTGTSISVSVSNAIQAPNFHEVMGTGLPITATIASNNAPYEITIRDEGGAVIRTLSGVANGLEITNYWDGLDELGQDALTNDFVTVTISYNPTFAGKTWVEKVTGNLFGKWIISFQANLFGGINQVVFENNMNQVVQFATSHGGVVTGSRFEIDTGPSDWNTLYTLAPQARNIYFYGHGGPTRIGHGQNDPGNGARASAISSVLKNRLLKEQINLRHPYRFVFLDGCETGSKGSEWPAAFGIMPAELTATDFARLGLARRAFLGWKKKIATTSFDTSRHTFVLNFFDNWLEGGQNLSSALASAANGTVGSSELNKLQIWGDSVLPAQ